MAVVALALQDDSGRILLQKRPEHKHHGGLWEFPGGKVESGETPRLALCREILEELGIVIDPAGLVPALAGDEGPDGQLVLILYTCRNWSGNVTGMEGQQWAWHSLDAAKKLRLAPIDADFLKRMAH